MHHFHGNSMSPPDIGAVIPRGRGGHSKLCSTISAKFENLIFIVLLETRVTSFSYLGKTEPSLIYLNWVKSLSPISYPMVRSTGINEGKVDDA